MGKPGSDGALLKRPASQVSSNDGPLLSEAAVAELEAPRDIDDFRKRARDGRDGWWCNRSRADILEACRRVLNGVALLQSTSDINHVRECARELGVATQYRNAAGHWVNRRKADILESCRGVLNGVLRPELEAMRNTTVFRQRARELGLVTRHRNSDGW